MSIKEEEVVTLTRGEYCELHDAYETLNALKEARVENWGGREIAQDIMEENK